MNAFKFYSLLIILPGLVRIEVRHDSLEYNRKTSKRQIITM